MKKKKMQTSKIITLFLLIVWTLTWGYGLFQTSKDINLLPALYEYVQGCLLAVLPYFSLSAVDRMVYIQQIKSGESHQEEGK